MSSLGPVWIAMAIGAIAMIALAVRYSPASYQKFVASYRS